MALFKMQAIRGMKMNEILIKSGNSLKDERGNNYQDFDNFIEKGITHVKNEMRFNRDIRKRVGIKIIEREVIEEECHNYKIRKVKVRNELNDFIKIQNSLVI